MFDDEVIDLERERWHFQKGLEAFAQLARTNRRSEQHSGIQRGGHHPAAE
ncbi:hypothetical protein [Streptomyces sp. NPDC006341]